MVETDPLTRLVVLAAEHGVTVDVLLDKLLARDGHHSDHRCPTCARREKLQPDHMPDQLEFDSVAS